MKSYIQIGACRRAIQSGFAIVIILSASSSSIASDEHRIVLAAVEGSQDVNAGVAVVREAYRRLSIPLEIKWLQGKTALELSSSGQLDGEVQRIDGLDRRFEDLVQIPVPVNYLEGVAFAKKQAFPIKGWFSLRQYRIGIVQGILFAEQGTRGMRVTASKNYQDLVNLLQLSDIDVAVMPRINGLFAIQKANLKTVKEMPGVLETLFLYHYLHRKNAHLNAKVGQELKRMLLDGTTQRIRNEVYAKLLSEGT